MEPKALQFTSILGVNILDKDQAATDFAFTYKKYEKTLLPIIVVFAVVILGMSIWMGVLYGMVLVVLGAFTLRREIRKQCDSFCDQMREFYGPERAGDCERLLGFLDVKKMNLVDLYVRTPEGKAWYEEATNPKDREAYEELSSCIRHLNRQGDTFRIGILVMIGALVIYMVTAILLGNQ